MRGWMRFQTAVGQPSSNGFQHRPCLPFAPAMNDRIIGITLKAHAWIASLHPPVERVVQKQVGEQRTGHTALRGALGPLLPDAVRPLNGSAKPPPNVQPYPGQISVMCNGTFDQIMRNGIKECSDVQIDHPIELPAAFPCHSDRIERRTTGPIAIGIRVELRFHRRLQDHLHDRLRHAIGDRRDAERSHAAPVLGDLDEPHRRRMIRARRHPIPDLVQVSLQILLECRQRHAIDSPRTAVRPHLSVGVPDQTLRNLEWLYLRHRLLPSLVDRPPRLESRVPSLHPHYRASSLIRTRPSLCSASVLGSSRVCRLEVSLGIGAPGSHVPHRSLSLVSRRLHAGRRSASQQAPSELPPRPTTGAWFRRRPYAFDTSSTIHLRSSYQRTPDG